jgi:hypothetical protein
MGNANPVPPLVKPYVPMNTPGSVIAMNVNNIPKRENNSTRKAGGVGIHHRCRSGSILETGIIKTA